MKKERVFNYQFTGYDGDSFSYFKLSELRKAVKAINRLSKESFEGRGKKFRVEVRGRLGKYNPAYEESYKNTRNGTSYIRLADATRWDVYLYERYQD
tara:strand:+ start:528 stop:818 length:291 start_codon:yes stop_codon:yes gene_type:complete